MNKNNMKSPIPPKLIDSYELATTNNILYKQFKLPNPYISNIIVTVIKSYTIDESNHKNNNNEWTMFYDDMFKYNSNYTYEELAKIIGEGTIPSFEHIISSALYAYKNSDLELLIRTSNIFGRPIGVKNKNEWLDNWTLNGLAYSLSFVFNKEYNHEYIVTLSHKSDEQNNNILFPTSTKSENIITLSSIHNIFHNDEDSYVVHKLVNIFRTFLIVNGLLPYTEQQPVTKINMKDKNVLKNIIEISVKYFPMYYVGCIACDWFNDRIAASINTIAYFLQQYPSVYVYAIVNASSSKTGDGGSHWMGLYFYNDNNSYHCTLLCPQASDWSVFKDNNELRNTIVNNKKVQFIISHSPISCQRDKCNCGLYSLLFMYTIMLKDGNYIDAVKAVGEDANNLSNNNDVETRMIFKIKGKLIGYDN